MEIENSNPDTKQCSIQVKKKKTHKTLNITEMEGYF